MAQILACFGEMALVLVLWHMITSYWTFGWQISELLHANL